MKKIDEDMEERKLKSYKLTVSYYTLVYWMSLKWCKIYWHATSGVGLLITLPQVSKDNWNTN